MKVFLCTLLILLNCFCPGKAQNKNESAIPEGIYLHTDRNVYLAGDYLFYTLYLKGNPGQMSKYAYLVLRDRHNSLITQVRVDIRNQMAFGSIYLSDTLRSDIYQIVSYTNSMRNEGEYSYFTKEVVIANRFDKKLELFDSTLYTGSPTASSGQFPINKTKNGNLIIHLDKNVFNTREKITFSIEAENVPLDSITRLSVSISEIIPGIPAEPSISTCFNNVDRQSITSEPGQDHRIFLPEIRRSVIEGRVLSASQSGNLSVSVVNNYTILVSTPDSIANMQYTTTDSLGLFVIFLNHYYEGKELFIRLKENTKADIEIDSKFKLIQPFIPSEVFTKPGIRSYIVRSRNIFEVQKYYNDKPGINTGKAADYAPAIPRIYFKSYSTVFPADYLPLSDFMEISRELLPALKVRKSEDTYILSCIDTRNKGFLDKEPAIFLDGVPIDDVSQIINLGTDQITRIDILPVFRYYGEMPLPGILAVFSKNLEINNIQFRTPTIKFQAFSSLNNTKPEPYIPDYSNKHIPDVRQLLLWDPEIILHNKEKRQIDFYTSDLQGDYRISIQGITSNGLPLNWSAIITVQSKSN